MDRSSLSTASSCRGFQAILTASRAKLPIVLIAKGNSIRVEENQLRNASLRPRAHSKRGWATTKSFPEYLVWLRGQFRDDRLILLLFDCYSVQRNRETREFAKELEIIRAGMTGSLQSLDASVFATMKAICRRLYRRYFPNPDRPQFSIDAWDSAGWRMEK
jgi:hypothetical protein